MNRGGCRPKTTNPAARNDNNDGVNDDTNDDINRPYDTVDGEHLLSTREPFSTSYHDLPDTRRAVYTVPNNNDDDDDDEEGEEEAFNLETQNVTGDGRQRHSHVFPGIHSEDHFNQNSPDTSSSDRGHGGARPKYNLPTQEVGTPGLGRSSAEADALHAELEELRQSNERLPEKVNRKGREVAELQKEKKELQKCFICCIDGIKPVDGMLMPCCDLITCRECASKLHECPACKQIIKYTIPVDVEASLKMKGVRRPPPPCPRQSSTPMDGAQGLSTGAATIEADAIDDASRSINEGAGATATEGRENNTEEQKPGAEEESTITATNTVQSPTKKKRNRRNRKPKK